MAPAVVTPAGCVPAIRTDFAWIQVMDAAGFRFAAEPNMSSGARSAIITIGEASFFVHQEPPAQQGLAAAPGRLVFGMDKRGKTQTKRITGWSEKGFGGITAYARDPWLSVTPRRGKDNRQAYDVTVRPGAGLGPGRYDSSIELKPSGDAPSLRIPVVVEVPGVL